MKNQSDQPTQPMSNSSDGLIVSQTGRQHSDFRPCGFCFSAGVRDAVGPGESGDSSYWLGYAASGSVAQSTQR